MATTAQTTWRITETGRRTLTVTAASARDALLHAGTVMAEQSPSIAARRLDRIHGATGVEHLRRTNGGWRYILDGGRRIVEVTREA